MLSVAPLKLVRNGQVERTRPSIDDLRARARQAFETALEMAERQAVAEGELSFREFERDLRGLVLAVGRALLVLFLGVREQHVLGGYEAGRFERVGRTFRRARSIARNLTTVFGVVRYWRMYMREETDRRPRGFHPLDLSLGLMEDRLSWNVLAHAARLATEMSFASAREVLREFIPDAPSTEVIEQTMLGLGANAAAWFEQLPAPEDDGEVLCIEIDGKAAPTVTDRELARRRRKRSIRPKSGSPRHRGRAKRARHPQQPRRKKGDKSKNGKVVTVLVMYTLRRCGTRRLEGPVNRRHYASFGPKRHAFEIARREADKRGFTSESKQLIQVVTDGDTDYARLSAELFPHAIHTIDCYHVFEYLWKAGRELYREGSKALKTWVDEQKEALFKDDVQAVLDELGLRLDRMGKRRKKSGEKVAAVLSYLTSRRNKIAYGALRRRDLVISTGIAEGAVKHIVGKRCDHGGMRWIPERAQAVVQLRCIQIDGHWEAFEKFVHDRQSEAFKQTLAPPRLQTAKPQTLPEAA